MFLNPQQSPDSQSRQSDRVLLSANTPILPPYFVGREPAIAELDLLVARGARVIVIQARAGVGKTTLARHYLHQKFGCWLEFSIGQETQDIPSVESLIEAKLSQLGESPGREFLVSLDRLKRKLQTESMGILIDNLEPALDAAGKLIQPHRAYIELLGVLADPTLRSITLITSRERLHEPRVTLQHYLLKSLTIEAWHQNFQEHQLQVSPSPLTTLHHAYGGNAKAMEILISTIHQTYRGNLVAYWQAQQNDLLIERSLEDLVSHQFEHLRLENPTAYALLCRMGCYRYQDVPSVPIQALSCLLWDGATTRQKLRVIRLLQACSLIEAQDKQFWLHPVIRAEAIHRLRNSPDWEAANRAAATYWTESVQSINQVDDGLKAFEAYYHYLAIHDLNQASHVLLKRRRIDRINQTLSLSSSFYRLGLVHPIILATAQMIDNVESYALKGQLCSNLANLYRLIGNIQAGIQLQEKARASFRQAASHQAGASPLIHRLRQDLYSLLYIGLCKIDLWELSAAETLFHHIFQEAERYYLSGLATKALCYLALIQSITGQEQVAQRSADTAYTRIVQMKTREEESLEGSLIYPMDALGCAYTNLSCFAAASKVYQFMGSQIVGDENLEFRAKVLNGLAGIDRAQGHYATALEYYQVSLTLSERSGAKYDVAETYYQLGLTYQAMGDRVHSRAHYQLAIKRFAEMGAPRQVERVQRSLD